MTRKRIGLIVGIILVVVIGGFAILFNQKSDDKKKVISKTEKTTTEPESYTSENGNLVFYEEGDPDEIESVNWDDIFEEDGSNQKEKQKHSKTKEQISKAQGAEKKGNLQRYGESVGEKGKKTNEEKGNNNPSQKKKEKTEDSVEKQSENSKEEATKKEPIGVDNSDDGYISLPDDY